MPRGRQHRWGENQPTVGASTLTASPASGQHGETEMTEEVDMAEPTVLVQWGQLNERRLIVSANTYVPTAWSTTDFVLIRSTRSSYGITALAVT